MLPPLTQAFENFKKDNTLPVPNMNWTALTNCNLTPNHWKEIAKNMPWNTLRMNLNQLNKHKVFKDQEVLDRLVNKLKNPNEVQNNNAFPYQLLTTFQNMGSDIPMSIKLALQDAMEIATKNVPVLGNRVAVCVDVSASMNSPITGNRGKVSTATKCKDVAALIAASVARTNPETIVVSFGTQARIVPNYNPRDSVMTNSNKLADESRYCGHGTNASSAMEVLRRYNKSLDFVIFVSDMQSWMDNSYYSPGLMAQWNAFKRKNKRCSLVEINLQPYSTTVADHSDKDVMNIGGFSDSVFDVLAEFAHRKDNCRFTDVVEAVEL